jgi:predicted phage baseplate assembly protein
MALPLPNLDDRRWADLVDEGRTLIPVYAPDWTDHNVHDPGITFVELFAWVAEMDLYRINRVPSSHLRKFLALVGGEPRPPRAARTVVAFDLPDGSSPVALPADLELVGQDGAGTRTIFRTLSGLTVSALRRPVLLSGAEGTLADMSPRARRGEPVPLFGEDPRPGVAFYLGFEGPLPAGVPVSLFFSFAGERSGWEERAAILDEAARAAESCAPPAPCECGGADTQEPGEAAAAPPPLLPRHQSVRLAWEVRGAGGVWLPLEGEAVQDDTRALTVDGRVVLTSPVATVAAPQAPLEAALHYVRCRLVGGGYDAAPALLALSVNGVAAEQAEAIHRQPLPAGDGQPGQRIALPQAAVQDAALELETLEGADTIAWTQRADFDLSGRADAHYVLDADQAVAVCGDGERGRRLPSGAVPYATYRATRAGDGNLASGRVRAVADTAHNQALPDFGALPLAALAVTNPVPADGGAGGETLDQAALRALTSVEARRRAVTLGDIEALALETPGTRLARAGARPNLDAAFPCLEALGVITVVVLPFLPRSRPVPTGGTRRAVAAYLARRRVVGTRIVVSGPEYREVTVRARVRALRGTDRVRLRGLVLEALDRFLHPLEGGPEGTGWPFGRSVYRSEVLQVLDEVPGVDHVLQLEFVSDGCEASCGNVCLGPIGLPASGAHQIEVL